MKIKVNELSGIALDRAVAKCEGMEEDCGVFWKWSLDTRTIETHAKGTYSPSSNWSQGGPIIEREKISSYPIQSDGSIEWWCRKDGIFTGIGQATLIAAMRCYVASKLGEEVEIPDATLGVDNA